MTPFRKSPSAGPVTVGVCWTGTAEFECHFHQGWMRTSGLKIQNKWYLASYEPRGYIFRTPLRGPFWVITLIRDCTQPCLQSLLSALVVFCAWLQIAGMEWMSRSNFSPFISQGDWLLHWSSWRPSGPFAMTVHLLRVTLGSLQLLTTLFQIRSP